MRNRIWLLGLSVLAISVSAGCLSDIIPAHQGSGATPASSPDGGQDPMDNGGAAAQGGDDAAPATDGATAFSLTLEGEAATLTAPMAVTADANASGAQYIAVPAGGVGGKAAFTFNVPHDGSYVIWANVIGPTDANNSFHVSIDTDLVDNDPSDGTSTIWDLPITTTFSMVKINMRNSVTPTNVDQVYTLTAGSHTLYLNQREDSAGLDRLIITDDMTLAP